MRRNALAVLLLAAATMSAGCSQQENEPTPLACRQGTPALVEALREAPGRVRLGGVPLSDCVRDTSGTGSLRDVGQAYVQVAAQLADSAEKDPDGRAAMELGYLLGALERGQAGGQGVGYELTRRMRSELVRVDVRSAAFRRGRRAGLARG